MAERVNTAINDWFSQGYDDSGSLNTGDDGTYSGDEIADTDYSSESDGSSTSSTVPMFVVGAVLAVLVVVVGGDD